MNICFLCEKETKEEDMIFKKSKVFKGGICIDCYIECTKYHIIDSEYPPPSWDLK